MSAEPVAVDRRQRRRQETIAEVVDIAAEIMTEQGVAGLSVGEVARRMGIRPPSLYVYFPSKHALYDALFERGARLVLDQVRAEAESEDIDGRSLDEVLLGAAQGFVGWSIEHPAYTQLLFWRPVPGFTPTPEAYAPAVELVELSRARFLALQERGVLRADVDVDEALRDWTVLLAGVVSQQMSNAPDEPLEAGWFTRALPGLVAMYARHYGTPAPPSTTRRTTAKTTAKKETRHARRH
jgi:AcrR family transcriptional regulator